MDFNKNNYKVKTVNVGGESLEYRAFAGISYCDHPKDAEFQTLSIFVPECYYRGQNIGGYSLDNAPVFFPNSVGGYMPGESEEPGAIMRGPFSENRPNSLFKAVKHGYVAVSAGIRGRIMKNGKGENIGKAPALIVDYKAAVRYLHKFADELPGDMNKIITNGTSAGGALSSLIGAAGNHPDYEPYLKEIGAAEASDAVFAASCYCPITNLDHADAAYEWEFSGVYDYHRMNMDMGEGGRPNFTPVDADMDEERIYVSKELEASFPAYVNSLNLKDENSIPLTLDSDGNGSFKEYVRKIVLASANRQLKEHVAEKYRQNDEPFGQPEEKEWLKIEDGTAVDMDFYGWAKEITRMKNAPAFDDITNDSPENDEFGSVRIDMRHFTDYSLTHSKAGGRKAEENVIKMLNPMYYIGDDKAQTAHHWRIRHGECDRDTSLAISAMLALKLAENGCRVDYQAPWERPHSGDYDLDELFVWIDSICR